MSLGWMPKLERSCSSWSREGGATSVKLTPRWVSWRAVGSIHDTLDLVRCAFGTPTPTRFRPLGARTTRPAGSQRRPPSTPPGRRTRPSGPPSCYDDQRWIALHTALTNSALAIHLRFAVYTPVSLA